MCLVAIERRRVHQDHGCGSVVAYAEKLLHLDAAKAVELVRIGRLLENLPLLSHAFREGEIGYGKLREVSRVATSVDEAVEFARTHNTREVERQVACSPVAWRQTRAAQLQSCSPVSDRQPLLRITVDTPSQAAHLAHDTTAPKCCPTVDDSSIPCTVVQTPLMQETTHKVDESPRGDSPPSLPPPPNLIRLNVTLTADQYAVLEAALHKMQRRKGKRASMAVLLTELASQYLVQGDARSKVAHPVVVNVVAESGEAFYATERGCYTVGEVSSEVMVPRQPEKKAEVHAAEEQSNH